MSSIANPFEIKTPEQISAHDIVDLFVDVFSDFQQVKEKGHTFINGPRGSGKSMMFRYIMPDCQTIALGKKIDELDFFSIYVPIKLTSINIPDLGRLEDYAKIILNEHLFSTYVASYAFLSMVEVFGQELNKYSDEIREFYKSVFLRLLSYTGYNEQNTIDVDSFHGESIICNITNTIGEMTRECLNYCKRIALAKDQSKEYNGPICDFMDFVYPLLRETKKLPFFPKDKPFFILIDDAGYLNEAQTNILNTWVSYRTTKDICFKISTQLDYKSYITVNGKRIDSPHDYSEINISMVYSSSKSRYNDRVNEIVEKRIKKYLDNTIDVRDFFPENEKQKGEIEIISNKLKEEYFNPDIDYAARDAAIRYASSEYMKKMQKSKSGAHYSYAGFDNLVAISSGIIRHFLAPAQIMFSEAVIQNKNNMPTIISDSIQNEVIKRYSSDFLTDEFDKIRKDLKCENDLIKADKLYNLIDSLGELFHEIFVSDAKERRIFSVAITDIPDNELSDILEMGEQFGYLHKSTIGNKKGTGRCTLYILTRILAPHFKLDPTSFAGYKFMDSATLKKALTGKLAFLRHFRNKRGEQDDSPTLFDYISE